MSTPPPRRATEERLYQIRQAAADGKLTPAATRHPLIEGKGSYYGLPALKGPVWTWEVPLYIFLGGIAGVSGCMAFVGHLFRADPGMVRLLLWMAMGGAALCPVLLIADLGRPSRFLNMLRVFKVRSPMSMGVWILLAFSGAAAAGVLCHELSRSSIGLPLVRWLGWVAEFGCVTTGVLLASYTGVLIGATAIPVWLTHRRLLPAHFLTSGLGSAAGILELAGFLVPVTHILGFVASGVETLIGLRLLVRKSPVDTPLHQGVSGRLFRISGTLEGPVALLVRVLFGATPGGRWAAAVCFLVGALLSRFAWIWAGRASAKDVGTQFAQQRSGDTRP